MSKFNHYAQKANKIAKDALDELEAAHKAVATAEQQVKKYPQQTGGRIVDAEYLAKSARAIADLAESKSRLQATQNRMGDVSRQLANIRTELAEALAAEYAAMPGQVDAATMELLRSGILRPDEFARLMADAKTAGNSTMMRLIAKAATDTAEKYDLNDKRGQKLRAVAVGADDDAVSGKLGLFDVIVEVYNRTTSNIYMYDSWDELTSRAIEAL